MQNDHGIAFYKIIQQNTLLCFFWGSVYIQQQSAIIPEKHFVIKTFNLGRQTRSCTNLVFNIPRVKICESSTFYFNGIKDWNGLPLSVKECKTKDLFKTNTKIFLIQKRVVKAK